MIICDRCQAEVTPAIKSHRLFDGVDMHYIQCDQCEERYPSFFTNPEIREQRKDLDRMWTQFHASKSAMKREDIHKRIEAKRKLLAASMEELKANIDLNKYFVRREECIDITTFDDLSRGFTVELNTLTGEIRQTPIGECIK